MLKKVMSCVIVLALFSCFALLASTATSYNAYDQFDTADASGANVPWKYMHTEDSGATFAVNTNYVGDYKCWYPMEDKWFGVGTNADANATLTKAVELNSASKTEHGTLVFVAPEDGKYTIPAFEAVNLWKQGGSNLIIAVNGTVKYTSADGALDPAGEEDPASKVTVPESTYNLKKGDLIQFYNKPVTDSFVSLYVCNVTVNYSADDGNPDTGDMGTIVLAIIAVISLGAYVAIRRLAVN